MKASRVLRPNFVRIAAAGIAMVLAGGLGGCTERAGRGADEDVGASTQRKVRWQMQSAFGSKLPHAGPSATR
ncbi:MAG: hypothetical protein V3S71_04470, partial [Acidobacteriota bacterium]